MVERNSGKTEPQPTRDGGAPRSSASGGSDGRKDPNPAGPHAEPELTDESKTPGSGMLPEPEDDATEAPSG
ncbi:hypothetical protein [Rhodopseudomonas palustris]|uniref:Uncharacterized protein n=1 Tax=Rhodopseudomonas palustris TaxID=1076 RepID=A0A418VFD9_RHOPL|nr:hypothetical protein [Rhodopseudomonas palustris]RJF74781.1 hypothetical protein D4Q52_11755 [Rhodopseudomonas palustris]